MNLFIGEAFKGFRLHSEDVSAAIKRSIQHRSRHLEDGNVNATDALPPTCDDIGSELFGVEEGSSFNMTCQCSISIDEDTDVAGIDDTADAAGSIPYEFFNIDCQAGDAEVSIGMRDGELATMETCARYCNEDGITDCNRICIGDIYLGGDEPFFCVATMDGEDCSSCMHNKYGLDFDSFLDPNRCPGGDRIDIDCSKVGGRDYKEGHMCGHNGNITFEVRSSSSSAGYYGGYSGYSSSSYGSGSYSNSGDDDAAVGILMFILAVFVVAARVLCAIAVRDASRDVSRRNASRLRLNNNQNRSSPQYIQLSRLRGRNQEGDPVELVLVSLMENNVAVAKETLQDENKEFEYYTPGKDDPLANSIRQYVREGNWRSLRDALLLIEDNDDRSFYFGIVEEETETTWSADRTHNPASFSPLLDEWLENEPDVNCHILRASVGTVWSWHARSAALAFMVGERQRQLFHARLEDAAKEIEAARALSPSDPLVYANAITIKKGLGSRNRNIMSVEDCLEALNGTANEPFHYGANTRALTYYCKKWHGSHHQMFMHARRVTSQLPDGHPLWVLIPMAHIERTMIEPIMGYWKRPDVVNEIRESYIKAFPGESSHTSQVSSPAAQARERTVRNYFAFALAATGQCEDARRQIRIVGRRPSKIWPLRSIDRYKSFIDALGFDVSRPDNDESTTHHLTHAVATPVIGSDGNYDATVMATPVEATAIQIV